jgi:hypothetical protein
VQSTPHALEDDCQPLRPIKRKSPRDNPDPKARACYGLWVSCPVVPESSPEQVRLRFVDGRPVGGTTQDLACYCDNLEQPGRKALPRSGSTPPGRSAKRRASGPKRTTDECASRPRARVSALATCPARAHGSTRLGPTGSMASVIPLNRPVCLWQRNWPSGPAAILRARMSRTLRSPINRLDYALRRWRRPTYHRLGPARRQSNDETVFFIRDELTCCSRASPHQCTASGRDSPGARPRLGGKRRGT